MTHQPEISDEAVVQATGRPWGEWFALLNAAGMAERPDDELLVFLREEHGLPGWWQRAVAREFAQSIGRASKSEAEDGFHAEFMRELDWPAELVFAAWAEDVPRAKWLRRGDFEPVTVRPPGTVRGTWTPDGSQVEVEIAEAGEGRCRLAIGHRKLGSAEAAQRMRKFWEQSVDRLVERIGLR